jgi:hypothetical protein
VRDANARKRGLHEKIEQQQRADDFQNQHCHRRPFKDAIGRYCRPAGPQK